MSREQEELIIALIAKAQEDQKIVSMLIDDAEAQGEKVKNLEKQIKGLCNRIDEAGRSFTKKVETVLNSVLTVIHNGAQAGAHEALQNAAADAVADVVGNVETTNQGLKATNAEGQATARLLYRSGILLGVFLLAVGLIGWAGVGYMIDSRAEELANLKAQVEAEKATLAAIRGESWGMELIKYSDGRRAIVLPKGFKFSFTAEMKDEKGKKNGRHGVIIEPF